MNSRAAPLLLLVLTASGCALGEADDASIQGAEVRGTESAGGLELEWQAWRAERRDELLAPDSWLNLTGLHWLRPSAGASLETGPLSVRFGPGPENEVVLEMRPSLRDAPMTLGTLLIEPPGRFVLTASTTGLEVEGVAVQVGESVPLLALDSSGQGLRVLREVRWGPMSFLLIERGGNWALRVRDRSLDLASRLGELEAWKPTRRLVAQGRFESFSDVRDAEVPNVTPFSYTQKAVGEVVLFFSDLEGNPFEHRLLALGTDVSKPLFLVIADQTNGRTTYGGGRYLYAGPPDEQGLLEVDLNRLYNPPCAFTGWATCPLPPRQNRIPLEIEAGEKTWDYPH